MFPAGKDSELEAVGRVTGFRGDGLVLQRLTPSRYPATLRAVQVFFPQGEVAAGAPVNVLAGARRFSSPASRSSGRQDT